MIKVASWETNICDWRSSNVYN